MDPTTSFGQSGQLPRTWRFAALLDREFWWNRAVNYAISSKPGILVLGGPGIVGDDVSAAWRAPACGMRRPLTARSHQTRDLGAGWAGDRGRRGPGRVVGGGCGESEAAECAIPPKPGILVWWAEDRGRRRLGSGEGAGVWDTEAADCSISPEPRILVRSKGRV